MSLPTASPWLQEEFQQFLEQRYTNVKSQLTASEKEKDELRAALTEAEKRLEASATELSELRTAARVASNLDELQRVSSLLATEQTRRNKAERATFEVEAKVKALADELAQSKNALQVLAKEGCQECARQRTKIARIEAIVDSRDNEIAALRDARVRAAGQRAIAAAAETNCRQQLNNVTAELVAAKKEVSRLSATGDSATKASASTQIPYSKGTQMFRSFMDRMRALPAPPVTVDLSTILPVKLPPGSRRVSDCFHEGISKFPRLTVNDACMWLPDSQHALRVVPGFGYDSRPRCRKWTPYVPRSATYIPKGTFELFHTHDDDLYYVGTYKTVEGPRDIHLKVIDTRLLAQLDGTVVVDDLEEALTWQTAPKAPPTNAVARTIPEMYEMGILRVQVIGLQCVGFNHRLHEELHPKRMPSDDTSRKSDTDVQRRRGSSAKRRSVSWLDALSSDDSIVLSDGEPPSKRQRSHTGAEMSDRDPSSSTLYPDHSDPVTPS